VPGPAGGEKKPRRGCRGKGKRSWSASPVAEPGDGPTGPEACVAPPGAPATRTTQALQVDTETDAGRAVAVAEGTADRERGALAELLRVAHRQRALAVLPAGAHRQAA